MGMGSGTTTSRTLDMRSNSSVCLRFTTNTAVTAGLVASRFTICRPTFPVEPSTTAEYGCMVECSDFIGM